MSDPNPSIVEAAEAGERHLLMALRSKVATALDEGVPTHALAGLLRLIRELDRDLRYLDVRREEDVDPRVPDDEPFDPSTI